MKLLAHFFSFYQRMISQENIGSECRLIERNLCWLPRKKLFTKKENSLSSVYIIDQALLQDGETFYLETWMWLHVSMCNAKEYDMLRKYIHMNYEMCWCHKHLNRWTIKHPWQSTECKTNQDNHTRLLLHRDKMTYSNKTHKHFRTSQTLEQP